MKFEYKTFWLELPSNQVMRADRSIEALQKLGEEGWEVSVKLCEYDNVTSILLLKRLVN